MCIAVDDRDANFVIVLILEGHWGKIYCGLKVPAPYRVRILANLRRTCREDIGRVELGEHSVRLACINHKKNLVVPSRTKHSS